MRTGNRFGVIALWLGAVAVPLTFVAQHAENSRLIGSASLLNWLDAQGLVKAPRPDRVAELTNPSAFLVTDEIAIRWLMVNGLCLATYALFFALWAEVKREDTLYLSAGFTCGILAFVPVSVPVSVAVMCIGAALLLAIRRTSRA